MSKLLFGLNPGQSLWRLLEVPTSFMLSEVDQNLSAASLGIDDLASEFVKPATVDEFTECCEENGVGVVAAWLHLKVNMEYPADILEA